MAYLVVLSAFVSATFTASLIHSKHVGQKEQLPVSFKQLFIVQLCSLVLCSLANFVLSIISFGTIVDTLGICVVFVLVFRSEGMRAFFCNILPPPTSPDTAAQPERIVAESSAYWQVFQFLLAFVNRKAFPTSPHTVPPTTALPAAVAQEPRKATRQPVVAIPIAPTSPANVNPTAELVAIANIAEHAATLDAARDAYDAACRAAKEISSGTNLAAREHAHDAFLAACRAFSGATDAANPAYQEPPVATLRPSVARPTATDILNRFISLAPSSPTPLQQTVAVHSAVIARHIDTLDAAREAYVDASLALADQYTDVTFGARACALKAHFAALSSVRLAAAAALAACRDEFHAFTEAKNVDDYFAACRAIREALDAAVEASANVF